MKKLILKLITVIILMLNLAQAQPGGGGGLYVWGIYDSNLKPIDNSKDLHLKEIFVDEYYEFSAISKKPFHVKGGTDHERILIKYKEDTMVIDFLNIIDSNGAGYTDNMDSIVFQRGHFIYDRYGYSGYYQLLSNGITPYTIDTLIQTNLLYYTPDINIDSPKEDTIYYELFQGMYQLGQVVNNNYVQSIYHWQNFGEPRVSFTFGANAKITYADVSSLSSNTQARTGSYFLDKEKKTLTIYWRNIIDPMDSNNIVSISEKDVLKIICANSNGIILLRLSSNSTHQLFSNSPYLGIEPYSILE